MKNFIIGLFIGFIGMVMISNPSSVKKASLTTYAMMKSVASKTYSMINSALIPEVSQVESDPHKIISSEKRKPSYPMVASLNKYERVYPTIQSKKPEIIKDEAVNQVKTKTVAYNQEPVHKEPKKEKVSTYIPKTTISIVSE